jgi:hypothetical protein
LKTGRMSHAEVRKLLAAAPQGNVRDGVEARTKILRQRSSEIQAVESAMEQGVDAIFPKDSIVQRRRGLVYFHRIGMEITKKDGTVCGGIDILTPDPASRRDQLDTALAPAILLSTFFPKFYIAFSPGADATAIDEAIEALNLIDAKWIGVLKVDERLRLQIVRKPFGTPIPDRTSRYASLKSSLSVGRVSETRK